MRISMTALNKTYKVSNYSQVPFSFLNGNFIAHPGPMIIDHQSILFKEKGQLSLTNKLEIQKVKSFTELEENWDSYGAQKVSEEVTENSILLIEAIDFLDEDVYFTSPGPNGEIMIQLKNEDKEVELIVYESKTKFVTFENNEFKKQGDFEANILPKIIEWLHL